MSDPKTVAETPIIAASAAPAMPVVITAPTMAADRFDDAWPDLVATWLSAHVANSPIARSTDAFNHLVTTALPALRQALLEAL